MFYLKGVNKESAFFSLSSNGKSELLCSFITDRISFSGFESGIEHGVNTGTASGVTEIDGVFSALKNLGYSEKEILSVLKESGNADLPFEDRLKKALSLLTPLR